MDFDVNAQGTHVDDDHQHTSSIQQVVILGATGSIGANCLAVIRENVGAYQVLGVSGFSNLDKLTEICIEFRPSYVVVANIQDRGVLYQRLKNIYRPEIDCGPSALNGLASLPECHTVVAAIVGAAGLHSTLTAVESGKRVLLANKEALVMSGALLMKTAKQSGAEMVPIDSEHNAIFQCLTSRMQQECVQGNLNFNASDGVSRLILTASGGPFRGFGIEQLKHITPKQALCHPNWSMGPKISVDSATMMNKGLELIEASWLFNVAPEALDVLVHPQSIIHSMVEFIDGSVIAQMGVADMRIPIAQALSWPYRMPSGAASLDWAALSGLTFDAPDNAAFPCLTLAKEVNSMGGTAPTILNAVNEEAVQAFLAEQIPFLSIPQWVSDALDCADVQSIDSLDSILEADAWARHWARQRLVGHARASSLTIDQ